MLVTFVNFSFKRVFAHVAILLFSDVLNNFKFASNNIRNGILLALDVCFGRSTTIILKNVKFNFNIHSMNGWRKWLFFLRYVSQSIVVQIIEKLIFNSTKNPAGQF